MIDKISYKIINELRYDGRASNAQLARKLGISVITIAKKIDNMINKGVIVIKAIPNPVKMGYRFQALLGLTVDPKKMDSVCDRLTKNMHVHMVTTCLGRFNILLIVFLKELEALQDFIKIKLPQIEGIYRIEPYFFTTEKRTDEGILSKIWAESRQRAIDELDNKIIKELIKDGRPNYADLAKKLGVSRPTISRRVSLLLKDDVFKILAIPNPSKLGYTANAYVLVKTEYAKIDNICDRLADIPEIHLIRRLMNGSDILLGIYSTMLNTLYDLLHGQIGNLDGVLQLEAFICGPFFYFSSDAVFTDAVFTNSFDHILIN